MSILRFFLKKKNHVLNIYIGRLGVLINKIKILVCILRLKNMNQMKVFLKLINYYKNLLQILAILLNF